MTDTATLPTPPAAQPPPVSASDRQPGETPKAFAAFRAFLRMGADRSIRKIARKQDKSVTTVGEWSVKFNWIERAKAYDDDMAAKEQAAIEQEQKAAAKRWADRAQEHRERRFQLGLLMIKKAEKILKGRGKFTQAAAHRLAQVGDSLVALSADLSTSNTTVSPGDDAGPIITAPAGMVHVYLPAKKSLPDESVAIPAAAAPANPA